jgi:multiple antibiotic resistance protein
MSDLMIYSFTVFMGLFAIMNPIANTPIFLALTANDSPEVTRRVALKGLLLTFCLLASFALLGLYIFEIFGIGLPAFRVTGGALVALIGYQMLQGDNSSVHSPSEGDTQDSLQVALSVAVSPLAVPLLAGPGTIAAVMNFSAGKGAAELLVTLGAVAALCIITYFFFVFGRGMVRFIGQSGLNVVTRMMGLILAVIGVQMLIDGLKAAFNLPA